MEVQVTSDDARNLAAAIRRYADPKGIRRELNRSLSVASKPIRASMRTAAIGSLPASGGLRARMDGLVGQGRTTTSRGGIRISFAKNSYDARTLRGRIRHPLFGNRGFWFNNTASPPDEIEAEFNRQQPTALREVSRAMEGIARKVTNI
jgi:hypothetical protein